MAEQLSLDLVIPDRFEPLRDYAEPQLDTIIEPVEDALNHLDELHADMTSAHRGAFLVMRGESGTGKSTFLHTLHLFREQVESISLEKTDNVDEFLLKLEPTVQRLRVVVLEGREALKDVSNEQLEADLHSINTFVRRSAGKNTVIVWPCNADNLQNRLLNIAEQIGSDALLGVDGREFRFHGPTRDQFRKIAETTVATLNQGANLTDLGISDDDMKKLITSSSTVGKLLGSLRKQINAKKSAVSSLLKRERCRLWIVVCAGNEPDGEVASLTRGRYSAIDIERMMIATEANIVKDLKAFPEKLGILSTTLDAKVFHLPMIAALEIARTFADEPLKQRMSKAGLSGAASSTEHIKDRLSKTDLGKVLEAGAQGTRARGSRPGPNTRDAFGKLVAIAQSNDVLLNRAVGQALVDAGYIDSFATEKDFGSGLTRSTDLVCATAGGAIRVEMMWRGKTGTADIANYALTKLFNYGRAIGFLGKGGN